MKRLVSLIIGLIPLFCFGQNVQNIIPKVKNAVFTVYAEDENGDVTSSGSGFFISSSGIGITNFHVLEGAYGGKIKDVNGNYYRIKHIVDYNPQYDLIKFKVDNQTPTKYLSLSPTTPVQGEQVISYSTPLGVFENTVSTGIVSSIRKMTGYESVIQITAPISHGSSGSPVLNARGQVIGVATFGYEEGQSLNFAVNVSQIRKLTRTQNIKVGDMAKSPLETPLVKKAYLAANKGEISSAIDNLNMELARNTQNHLAYYLKGYILTRTGNYGDALDNLYQACNLDGRNYNYKIEFARTLRRAIVQQWEQTHTINNKLMKDAVSAYSDAIELDGERCYAYSDYAYMLYFVAIRMNPINTQALNYAKDYSSTAIALGHDPDNYLTRAMINSALKNYGEALIDCDEAIKYNPKYFRPYLKRADIKVFDLGQIDDGLIDAERALALAQTNQEKADVWGLKGMAYENKAFKVLNRESVLLVKKAFDSYEKAYELHPIPVYLQNKKDLENRINSYMNKNGSFP